MKARGPPLDSTKLTLLLRRLLEHEPGFVGERRAGGECFYCRGSLGDDQATPWLFAVAADGGLLLRLPKNARDGVIERGTGQANNALPGWVLEPPSGNANLESLHPESSNGDAPQDPQIHGVPEEWIWLPVPDVVAFERRRPHILEALSYCRQKMQRAVG